MEETKRCPACAETILAAALKCRYCGERLGEASQLGGAATSQQAVSIIDVQGVPQFPMKSWRSVAGFWGAAILGTIFMDGVVFPQHLSRPGAMLLVSSFFSLITCLPAALVFRSLYSRAFRSDRTTPWKFFGVFSVTYTIAFFGFWAVMIDAGGGYVNNVVKVAGVGFVTSVVALAGAAWATPSGPLEAEPSPTPAATPGTATSDDPNQYL